MHIHELQNFSTRFVRPAEAMTKESARALTFNIVVLGFTAVIAFFFVKTLWRIAVKLSHWLSNDGISKVIEKRKGRKAERLEEAAAARLDDEDVDDDDEDVDDDDEQIDEEEPAARIQSLQDALREAEERDTDVATQLNGVLVAAVGINAFTVGAEVMAVKLKDPAYSRHNRKMGRVVRVDAARSRVYLQMLSGEKLILKPENLLLEDPDLESFVEPAAGRRPRSAARRPDESISDDDEDMVSVADSSAPFMARSA